MKAKVHVTLKNGVLDPQGKAIETALDHLGFSGVSGVRVGKYIEVDLQGADKKSAQETVNQMCEKLLANTVVEKYAVEIAE
ncbi:MAG: phosphoribosylformylglycinamidine synthase subunit PurS [Rickettsiales bacterium]